MKKKISRVEVDNIVLNKNVNSARLVKTAKAIVKHYHNKDYKKLKHNIEVIKKDIWNIRYKLKHDLYTKLKIEKEKEV